jgi:hypothetical protein
MPTVFPLRPTLGLAAVLAFAFLPGCTRPIPLNPVPPVQTAQGRTCVQTCQSLYNECMTGSVGGLGIGGPAPGRGKFVNACRENLNGCYGACPL